MSHAVPALMLRWLWRLGLWGGRNLRLVPGSVRLLMELGMAALWPMLPLLLFKYPLPELAAKFVERLTGF